MLFNLARSNVIVVPKTCAQLLGISFHVITWADLCVQWQLVEEIIKSNHLYYGTYLTFVLPCWLKIELLVMYLCLLPLRTCLPTPIWICQASKGWHLSALYIAASACGGAICRTPLYFGRSNFQNRLFYRDCVIVQRFLPPLLCSYFSRLLLIAIIENK